MILLCGEDVEMRHVSVTCIYMYMYIYVQCTYVHERKLRSRERYLHGFVVNRRYLHEGEIAATKETA